MKFAVTFVLLSLVVLASATSHRRPKIGYNLGGPSSASGSASANNQGVTAGANAAGYGPADSFADASQSGMSSGRSDNFMNRGQDSMNGGSSFGNRNSGGSQFNNQGSSSDDMSDRQRSNYGQNWGSNSGGNFRDTRMRNNANSQSNGADWYDNSGSGNDFFNRKNDFFGRGGSNDYTNSFSNNAHAGARVG